MKILIHICLVDAEPKGTASIPLPGGLRAEYWSIAEPRDNEVSPASNGGAAQTGRRMWRRELPQPGLTYECYSLEEAAAVLWREMNDVPYLM